MAVAGHRDGQALRVAQDEAVQEFEHRLLETRRCAAAAASGGAKQIKVSGHGGACADGRSRPVAAAELRRRNLDGKAGRTSVIC